MSDIGYTQYGNGPQAVIVLHGWMGDSSIYDPILPYLDESRFTYLFMDYRGYGKSKDLEGNYSIKEIAQDAVALADSLGWARFHLLGHSMGGKAVQRIIADYESRVLSAVLLASVPGAKVPIEGEARERIYGAAEDAAKRNAIINAGTGMRLSPQWLSWMVEKSFETTKVEAFRGYTEAWVETEFVDELRGKQTPVLAIVGAFDMSITETLTQNTVATWLNNASVEVFQDAGHYPMQEMPVYTITRAEQYFSEHA